MRPRDSIRKNVTTKNTPILRVQSLLRISPQGAQY